MTFRKPNRHIDRVFIHCSASDHAHHDNVATMDRWHRERGWSGCGYHFFIRKDGTLETGRDINKTPAAQSGHNRGTIAICCHGLKKELFTQAQFKTLKALCYEINSAYSRVTFHGHREVAAKACPVFDYKAVLGLDRYGVMGGSPEVDRTHRDDSAPTLRKGSRGASVERLQQLLNIKDDGIFGPGTDKAVRKWQAGHGLVSDGIVGAKTWPALLGQ